MVVVENTADIHNVIVCTLCSCYPWPVLGLPPNWYKEPAYRSRIVKEPRKVLREDFGYELPDSVEVRVWDSSSEMRYWVLPTRPAGTDALSEAELAGLVTRDSMIGVGPGGVPGIVSAGMRPDATELGEARRRVEALVAGTACGAPRRARLQRAMGDPGLCDGRGGVPQRAVRVV